MIDFTDSKAVAKAIQYTNVNPDLTRLDVIQHLETAAKFGFDAAMIAPVWVSLGKEVLAGTGVRVASTLNFPMANDTLGMKLAALRELAKTGADEFDFPPNPGLLIGGDIDLYAQELNEVARVAHEEGMIVKAMLEFGYLDEAGLRRRHRLGQAVQRLGQGRLRGHRGRRCPVEGQHRGALPRQGFRQGQLPGKDAGHV
jgi:deoxyribose-phosphate aldolase